MNDPKKCCDGLKRGMSQCNDCYDGNHCNGKMKLCNKPETENTTGGWGERGSSERGELRGLIEASVRNPSNGNRHEEAIVDFIQQTLTTQKEEWCRSIEGMKSNHGEDAAGLWMGYQTALNDILNLIRGGKV